MEHPRNIGNSDADNRIMITKSAARIPDPLPADAVHKASTDMWSSEVYPVIMIMRKHGVSLAGIAKTLNLQHMPTRRGGTWTATAVKRVIEKINKGELK